MDKMCVIILVLINGFSILITNAQEITNSQCPANDQQEKFTFAKDEQGEKKLCICEINPSCERPIMFIPKHEEIVNICILPYESCGIISGTDCLLNHYVKELKITISPIASTLMPFIDLPFLKKGSPRPPPYLTLREPFTLYTLPGKNLSISCELKDDYPERGESSEEQGGLTTSSRPLERETDEPNTGAVVDRSQEDPNDDEEGTTVTVLAILLVVLVVVLITVITVIVVVYKKKVIDKKKNKKLPAVDKDMLDPHYKDPALAPSRNMSERSGIYQELEEAKMIKPTKQDKTHPYEEIPDSIVIKPTEEKYLKTNPSVNSSKSVDSGSHGHYDELSFEKDPDKVEFMEDNVAYAGHYDDIKENSYADISDSVATGSGHIKSGSVQNKSGSGQNESGSVEKSGSIEKANGDMVESNIYLSIDLKDIPDKSDKDVCINMTDNVPDNGTELETSNPDYDNKVVHEDVFDSKVNGTDGPIYAQVNKPKRKNTENDGSFVMIENNVYN